MIYRLSVKTVCLSIVSALFVSLGLFGLWNLSRAVLSPVRIKVEEAHNISGLPNGEDIYARSFQCANVQEVQIQLLFVRAGEVTDLWDGYYRRTSGAPPSSSCLFMLISGPSDWSPRIDFSFAGGSSSSGRGVDSPLPLIQSLEAAPDLEAQDRETQENLAWRSSSQVEVPAGTSIAPEIPTLLYYEYYYPSGQAVPELSRVSSIQAVKNVSSQHQNLSFLAVNLLWSE